ncbi:FMRFamide receptor-like [Lingula anatina]|uniref:FMRFamide receptor-like n=1 Tax=Lingula anatina TaxID=7574 RepID=A0A1S3KDM0_LINAN|nr:FMRFamide receptor-like [Lingula anatina]|eukprot:XP_013420554.1 FMRFamide receptor-like [Lingula anatina]
MNNSSLFLCRNATVISERKLATMFYIHAVLAFGFIIFGLCGNLLAFIVLWREKQKTTTSLTLRALAVSDSIYLVCSLIFLSLPSMEKYNGQVGDSFLTDTYPQLMPFVKPMLYISQQISSWLVVLVTLDRFIVVCYPLKSFTYCTLNKAKKHIAAVYIVSVLYNIPRFFELDIKQCYNIKLDKFVHEVHNYPWSYSTAYWIIYQIVLYFLTMYIVPMVVLGFVNTKLIISLRAANRQRAQITGKEHDDNISIMLVVVVFVFIACQTPDFLLQIFYFMTVVLSDATFVYEFNFFVYYLITAFLLVFNCSINFIIYCICGKKFRKMMFKTIQCQRQGHGDKSESSHSHMRDSKC